MGLLASLGLRRRSRWESRTPIDWLFESPIQGIVYYLYAIIIWLRGNPVKPPRNRPPIKIVFLSDTHESIVPNVPDGDLLIHCGDMTNDGTAASIQKQIDWLASLPHRHKVVVAGNHDSWFDINSRKEEDALGHRSVNLKTVHYLERKSISLTFKGGRKLIIYGAPDIPQCGGADSAFQYTIDQHPWEGTIPQDTEILVTHTPPIHHQDLSIGCPGLLREIWKAKPKVHVYGHVHCGRGIQAAYWDDCQEAYELAMSRKKRGLIFDFIPNRGWLDVLRVLRYGIKGVIWQRLWLGGASNGSVMVNAAMQAGTSGRLTKEAPFTLEV
ncbi:calcineurin-like phosphoesterase [Xylariaceae sp. FL1019]|nr:calcineurin-like phosphoesterase [Xylariaceae sp. FL1019]